MAEFVFPHAVLELAERVEAAGGELYVVGGWVRDALRGVDSTDIDLATDLPPAAVRGAVEDFDAVFTVGERFGTIGAEAGDLRLEITTFRSDFYEPGSRHPRVGSVGGIEEDLSRRDFTVNAMAVRVASAAVEFVDPFGGRGDMEAGLLKTPGDSATAMREDPLRMMRAARFASQLGYRLDPDLLSTITREAGLLDTISRERRRDELEKVLVADDPGAGLRILADTGLLVRVSPELAAMIGVEQPPNYHRADVFEHSVLTVEASEADPLLRRAALFHDVGKPPAKVTEPRTRFPDHQKIGESLTREAMARLRYGKDDIDRTAFLVRRHMRPILYGPEWSDAAVRRFVKDCTMVYGGEVVVPLEMVFSLARADILAGSLETVEQNLALLEGLKKRIESLESVVEVVFAQSPLDGSELMELLDRPPGPWLRDAKEFLQRLVVEGRLDPEDTDEAKRLARDYISDRYGRSP